MGGNVGVGGGIVSGSVSPVRQILGGLVARVVASHVELQSSATARLRVALLRS